MIMKGGVEHIIPLSDRGCGWGISPTSENEDDQERDMVEFTLPIIQT